jgi:hypothetical protein
MPGPVRAQDLVVLLEPADLSLQILDLSQLMAESIDRSNAELKSVADCEVVVV